MSAIADFNIPQLSVVGSGGGQGTFLFKVFSLAVHAGGQGNYAVPLVESGYTGAIGDYSLKTAVVNGYVGLTGYSRIPRLSAAGDSGGSSQVGFPAIIVDGQGYQGPFGELVLTPTIDAWAGCLAPVSLPKLLVNGDARNTGDYRFLPTVVATAMQGDSGFFLFNLTITANRGGFGNFYYSQPYNLIVATGHQEYTYSNVLLDGAGEPLSCTVVAFSETDHSVVGTTTTDPATGEFSITVDRPCYLVCLTTNTNRNAITIARGQVYA